MNIFQQFELPVVPSADQGVSNNTQPVLSQQANNTPYATTQDNSNLAPRVESLEKYVQDIYAHWLKQGGDGSLRNLDVTDKFSANLGKIAGWYFSNGVMQTPKMIIDSNNEEIRSANYVPGTSGFKVSQDLVEAENIKARGQLKGVTFSVDDVSAVGGQLMVSNADNLEVSMTTLDSCKLETKGSSDFAVDDIILIQQANSGVDNEWFRITAKEWNVYTVDRDLAGAYLPNEKPAWEAGTPVVKQGFWSADSGNKYTAPVLTGLTWVSDFSVFNNLASTYNNGNVKLNINWNDYDNVWITATTETAVAETITQSTVPTYWGNYKNRDGVCGQSFTANCQVMTKVSIYFYTDYGSIPTTDGSRLCEVDLIEWWEITTGTVLATKPIPYAAIGTPYWFDIVWDTPVNLTYWNQYSIRIRANVFNYNGNQGFGFASSNVYANGVGYRDDSADNYDMGFKVFGKNKVFLAPSTIITQDSDDWASGLFKLYSWISSGQSFTMPSDKDFLTSVSVYCNKSGSPTGTLYAHIYLADSNDFPTGSALWTTSVDVSTISSSLHYEVFTFNIHLSTSTKYCIVLVGAWSNDSNCIQWTSKTSDVYSGWKKIHNSGSWQSFSYDARFKVDAYLLSSGYDAVATALQTAIRAITSRLETVVYSTDHFVITGVTPDYLISVSSPSTGTDVSGAGAIKYLDLANGTSTQGGYGSGGWLRLIGEGTNSPYYSVYQRLSGLYNDYREVCRLGNLNWFLDYTTDEYGIAIGDALNNLTYDITNSLRIKGGTFFEVIPSSTLRTSANDARNSSGATAGVYQKYKEILYNDVAWTITVKCDLSSSSGGYGVDFLIYKNWVSLWVGGSNNSTNTYTYSNNISVTTWDLIQIYSTKNQYAYANLSNFRIYYDKQVKPDTNTVNLN